MSARVPPALERIVLGALLGGILGGLACGDAETPPQHLYVEDFEDASDCDGLPCGWEQIGGEDGQARYGETIHVGEHGLILSGAGASVRGPGEEEGFVLALVQGSLDARVSARCDAGSSLIIQAAITTAGEAGAPATDTFEGRATPPEDWVGESVVPMTASMALDPSSPFGCGATTPGGTGLCVPQSFRVTGITISKTGSGECAIDRIVMDAAGFVEEPGTSC